MFLQACQRNGLLMPVAMSVRVPIQVEPARAPGRADVTVLNGVSVPELAAYLSDKLSSPAFRIDTAVLEQLLQGFGKRALQPKS